MEQPSTVLHFKWRKSALGDFLLILSVRNEIPSACFVFDRRKCTSVARSGLGVARNGTYAALALFSIPPKPASKKRCCHARLPLHIIPYL